MSDFVSQKDANKCYDVTTLDCTDCSGRWPQSSIVTSQHCLVSFWQQTNIKISWDFGSYCHDFKSCCKAVQHWKLLAGLKIILRQTELVFWVDYWCYEGYKPSELWSLLSSAVWFLGIMLKLIVSWALFKLLRLNPLVHWFLGRADWT